VNWAGLKVPTENGGGGLCCGEPIKNGGMGRVHFAAALRRRLSTPPPPPSHDPLVQRKNLTSSELFAISVSLSLGFSKQVSQRWASPVEYYNSVAFTRLVLSHD
jgi:hypothetical protein